MQESTIYDLSRKISISPDSPGLTKSRVSECNPLPARLEDLRHGKLLHDMRRPESGNIGMVQQIGSGWVNRSGALEVDSQYSLGEDRGCLKKSRMPQL